MDPKPPTSGVDQLAGQHDGGAGVLAWFGGDIRQIDANQADAHFHSNPPILQSNERCEMAFKGRRDMVLFTNKRFIDVNVQGLTGQKTSYMSVPWGTVKCFAVQSAGPLLDKDSEMKIWYVAIDNSLLSV